MICKSLYAYVSGVGRASASVSVRGLQRGGARRLLTVQVRT
jgi:hypothetical protein